MKLMTKLAEECKKLHYTESQLQYVREIVREYNPNYMRDYNLGEAFRDSNRSELRLENQTFDELNSSVFDRTEEMSEQSFSDNQLDKLSEAERLEVLKKEIDMRKSRKTIDNDRIKHLQEYAESRSIKLEDKITLERPPEPFTGVWEATDGCQEAADIFFTIGDMFLDLRKRVTDFKPQSELRRQQAFDLLKGWIHDEVVPFSKVAIAWGQGVETTLRNITDEKYGQTSSGWMKIATEKFLESGNHGAGEVNAVLTGKYELKLGKYDIKDEEGKVLKTIDCLIRTPVKREFTREEVGDKTVFEMTGQIDIKCPECSFEFNKPIVADEERDLIAGDLFEQAKKAKLKEGLSNFVDFVANEVITEQLRDPKDIFRELMKKKLGRDVTEEELNSLKIINHKPEKIKAVDLNPNNSDKLDHSMLNNAARRRHDKSDHFSRVA